MCGLTRPRFRAAYLVNAVCPPLGDERQSDFGSARSVDDPDRTLALAQEYGSERPRQPPQPGSSPVSGSLGASRVVRAVHQAQMMPESAEHAVLGFRGQAIKQVGPRLIRLGQRQRAIAGSADMISRNHCPSPTRVMFNPPSALPALTFGASHAAGGGSVRSVTPLSQRADATRVERACVIVLT